MGIFGGNTSQARYSGQLHNLQLTQAVFGTTAPMVFGTCRVAAKMLFYGGFYSVNAPNSGGAKGVGNSKNQQFEYYADTLLALASGSASSGCQGILNVWDQQGKLQNQSGSFNYTVPTGGGSTNPTAGGQPPIQINMGVSKNVPYSTTVNDFGSGGSKTLSGTQSVAMELVTGTPGAGQYNFDASTSTYTFSSADAGTEVTISYSSVFSLYYFEQTQAAEVPLASPYQVSTDNQMYFDQDLGVINVNTGAALVEGTDYTQSQGVYTFSSALAGAYVYINYSYTSSDQSITNTTTQNITFFGGTLGQSPWSYMQSKYPGSAFGYTGLCYAGANPMALGMSAVLPSYNYEVVGLDIFSGGSYDAHPCDIFRTLLYDAFLGVGFPEQNVDPWTSCYAYWAANGYLVSKSIDMQTSVSEALTQIITTGNAAPFWSEGLLKLVPYGDTTCIGNGYTYTPNTTPVATLTWNDLLPPSGSQSGGITQSDPLQVSVRAPQDCMNYVQAQFMNRANDYNNDLINEQNDAFVNAYGRRIEAPQNWDWITNAATATWALNLRLKRECYIRASYKFSLPFWFSYIEPMDVVTLPTGENVRITQVDDAPNGELAFEAEQWNYGSANASIYPKQTPSSFQPTLSQAVPGSTYAALFETSPQGALTKPNSIEMAVAGNQANWGGCDIYVSTDNATFDYLATVNGTHRVGVLSAALAAGSDPDTTDTLSVDMTLSGGSLVTVTQADADAYATLAAIIDADGTIELVSFETATLTAANRYNLTYLRRGVYGTKIAAHSAGASFCYIGITGTFNYDYPAQYVGKPLYFKFPSFNLLGNQLQNLSACQVYTYSPVGTSYPAPLDVTLTQSATNTSGSGGSTSASDGVTVTPDGGLTTSAKVWLTVNWSWPANYPTPSGFNVVVYTGTDPTNAANYLFDLAKVGPTVTSFTVAVTPNAAMNVVNAAVEAVYA